MIAGKKITAEQTTKHTDGDLKILDRNIAVERQMSGNKLACAVRLVVETQKDHSVERVDGRHIERDAMPVSRVPAEGTKLVVPPGILLIAIPGVQEFFLDAFGRRRRVGW